MQLHRKRLRAANLDQPRPILLHLSITREIFTHVSKDKRGVFVGRRNEAIVHPFTFPTSRYYSRTAQVGEMPRDLRLRHLQDFGEEAHTNLIIPH